MRLKKPVAERAPMIYHNFDFHQSHLISVKSTQACAYQKVDWALTEANENHIET
jgi:hypothetical protein